jgi:hypothetical protein
MMEWSRMCVSVRLYCSLTLSPGLAKGFAVLLQWSGTAPNIASPAAATDPKHCLTLYMYQSFCCNRYDCRVTEEAAAAAVIAAVLFRVTATQQLRAS